MELVCPVCNTLQAINTQCPECGHTMTDGGALENFFGPYSPYMEKEDINRTERTQCVHLLFCPNCHFDMRVAWNLTVM